MNNQTPANTPSTSILMSEEKIVEFMRKSKSLKEWKIREDHLKIKLGKDFSRLWTKAVLLSGLAEEMYKKFENHEHILPGEKNSWDTIKIAGDSGRIAPI